MAETSLPFLLVKTEYCSTHHQLQGMHIPTTLQSAQKVVTRLSTGATCTCRFPVCSPNPDHTDNITTEGGRTTVSSPLTWSWPQTRETPSGTPQGPPPRTPGFSLHLNLQKSTWFNFLIKLVRKDPNPNPNPNPNFVHCSVKTDLQ